MRLKRYMIEQDDPTEGIDKVKENCKPFLKDAGNGKSNGYYLVRFLSRDLSSYEIKRPRRERKPKDTPLYLHNLADEYLKKEFGGRARSNAVFCWSSLRAPIPVESKAIIFPIERYKVIGNPKVIDLYMELNDFAVKLFDREINDEEFEEYQMDEVGKEFLKSRVAVTYKSGDIAEALKSRSEIMLGTKTYYAIPGTSKNMDLAESLMKGNL